MKVLVMNFGIITNYTEPKRKWPEAGPLKSLLNFETPWDWAHPGRSIKKSQEKS